MKNFDFVLKGFFMSLINDQTKIVNSIPEQNQICTLTLIRTLPHR